MIELPQAGTKWEQRAYLGKDFADTITVLKTDSDRVWYQWNGDNNTKSFGSSDTYAQFHNDFRLYVEPERPEVEPTMYLDESVEGNYTRLHVMDSKEFDQILLITESKSPCAPQIATLMSLDADGALDLAHDLTRMAMQLKRRIN